MIYIVFTKVRDSHNPGTLHAEIITRQELAHRLQPDEHGSSYYAPLGGGVEFVSTPERVTDTDQFPPKLMIVKGEVVFPAERDLHTKYEIP
jgi:hypothetical protein